MGRAFEYRRASKEARWGKMSKIFPKLGKAITLAAKEGGDNPDTNNALRTAILAAKAENMPKDNIQRAIERASSKEMQNFATVNYEAKGAGGAFLFIECATDNNTRTFNNVRTIINKAQGELLKAGALKFIFEHKCLIACTATAEVDLEEIELALMDYDVEEITITDNIIEISAPFQLFDVICKGCEELSLSINEAVLVWLPKTMVTVNTEEKALLDILIDKLNDDDDVQHVFTNVEGL